MTIHLENQTISIEPLNSRDDEASLLANIESYRVLVPHFLLMSRATQIATTVINWINATVFTYFRGIIYYFIFKEYKSKNINEINILTIIVCLAQHLEIIGMLIHEMIVMTIGDDWPNLIPPLYCIIQINMYKIQWIYSVMGSLGIAVYRILLIKYDILVRDKIGERNLMWIILLVEFVFLALIMLTWGIFNPFRNPLRPACMHQTGRSMTKILDDYRQSLGYPSLIDSLILFLVSVSSLLLILEVVEIVIYVLFFHHMYKHDNNDRLKRLLEAGEIKRRNAKNAMSFFSLFCSFAVEITSIIMLLIFKFMPPEAGILLAAYQIRRFNLSAMAIVEVFTSFELRSMVIGFK